MIWDCFPYWREHNLVAARQELWRLAGLPVHMVAFVGDRTHRGDQKPEACPPPPPGVRVVSVTLDAGDDWGRERQQRDAVIDLRHEMADDDLVLLCDADEIVNPAKITDIREAASKGRVGLKMAVYMWGTEWRSQTPWRQAKACKAEHLPRLATHRVRLGRTVGMVQDAGWHLTYFDADVIGKLAAFAHAEWDTPEKHSQLIGCRANLTDLEGAPLVYDPLIESSDGRLLAQILSRPQPRQRISRPHA